jgi:hypothetical protein
VDIDECAADPCVNGFCINGRNDYSCDCTGSGYTGTNCETDIDECMTNNGGCDPLTTCVNRPGSVACGDCPSGYDGNGSTGCSDINECSSGAHDCDNSPAAACSNTPGSFDCRCPTGYEGSGHGTSGCSDINECNDGTDDCDTSPAATCVNTGGSFNCTCPSGYTGSGHGSCGCTDINECTNGTHDCDTSPAATCTNTGGSFDCSCPSGYSGSGHGSSGCVNINDCSPNPCRNGGTCTDGVNTFTCTCPSPWTGSICGNATLVIPATDQGAYNAAGVHDNTNEFAFAGYTQSTLHRAFWVFAIPNFTGTVSTVSVRGVHNIYNSPDASESGSFRDYTGSIPQLVAGGTGLTSIYTDLGNGTQYGSFTLTAATLDTILTYNIAAAATNVSNARG